LEMDPEIDVQKDSAGFRTACPLVVHSVDRHAELAETAGMRKLAAEGSHVRATRYARMVRKGDSHEEGTAIVPANNCRRSEDRMTGGYTSRSPFRAQFCGIDDFRDSRSARGFGRGR
jgi:hypothetical protein